QEDGSVVIRSLLGLPDASEVMGEMVTLSQDETSRAGEAMAERLIAQGAMELLHRAEVMANEV
ncbi:MAG: hydroxymethylbilane synthase, partial [Sulfuricurvum sp.]|nr:hydroxymethylbilane synthase [Sulfuricurvum sp.]